MRLEGTGWQVYNEEGRRKYLSGDERMRFQSALDRQPADVRGLGYLLLFTGCRISEALGLTHHQVDQAEHRVILRTLKRRRTVFRSIPIPENVTAMLLALPARDGERLWTMHRVTAYRYVKQVMHEAAIEGPMACCRGLRHGFAMLAAGRQVPPNLLTKWMGHASTSTTAIYLDAVGFEERRFAGRMW